MAARKRHCGWDSPPRQKRKEDDEEIGSPSSLSVSSTSSDEKLMKQQKAYERYAQQLRELLGDEQPGELLKDRQPRSCLVCKTSKCWTGWNGVISHAKTFNKKDVSKHRGFFKALEEVVAGKAERREAVTNNRASGLSTQRQIVWPPILLVQANDLNQRKQLLSPFEAVLDQETQQSEGLLVKLKANMLALSLSQASMVDGIRLVQVHEVDVLDPLNELGWCKVVDDEVRQQLKEMETNAAKEAALVRSRKLKMLDLDERKEELDAMTRSQRCMLEEARDQLTSITRDAALLQQDQARKAALDDSRFAEELRRLDMRLMEQESRLRRQLDSKRCTTEQERSAMLQYNNHLKLMLTNGTQRAKALAQALLNLQEEEQNRQFNLNAEEKAVQENCQNEEMNLMVQQEAELKQLEEECQKELEEELEREKQGYPATSIAAAKECGVCFGPLQKRAILPCGHARTCFECAMEIFKLKLELRRCPECRQPLTSEPIPTSMTQVFT